MSSGERPVARAVATTSSCSALARSGDRFTRTSRPSTSTRSTTRWAGQRSRVDARTPNEPVDDRSVRATSGGHGRIGQRGHGVRGSALLHDRRRDPRVVRARLQQGDDRVGQRLTGHVVDVRLDQHDRLTRTGLAPRRVVRGAEHHLGGVDPPVGIGAPGAEARRRGGPSPGAVRTRRPARPSAPRRWGWCARPGSRARGRWPRRRRGCGRPQARGWGARRARPAPCRARPSTGEQRTSSTSSSSRAAQVPTTSTIASMPPTSWKWIASGSVRWSSASAAASTPNTASARVAHPLGERRLAEHRPDREPRAAVPALVVRGGRQVDVDLGGRHPAPQDRFGFDRPALHRERPAHRVDLGRGRRRRRRARRGPCRRRSRRSSGTRRRSGQPWARLVVPSIRAMAQAAPKPLSMPTTVMPAAHDASIDSSAVTPSKPAPYPVLVGTATTGAPGHAADEARERALHAGDDDHRVGGHQRRRRRPAGGGCRPRPRRSGAPAGGRARSGRPRTRRRRDRPRCRPPRPAPVPGPGPPARQATRRWRSPCTTAPGCAATTAATCSSSARVSSTGPPGSRSSSPTTATHCVGRLARAVDGLGQALAQRPVVVDAGEAEVGERQAAQAGHRLVGLDGPRPQPRPPGPGARLRPPEHPGRCPGPPHRGHNGPVPCRSRSRRRLRHRPRRRAASACGPCSRVWARSSSRSAAAPTRPSWPWPPATRWAPTGAPAVTAVSASLAPDELADCRALADEWQLRWSTVATDEIDDPTYVANDGDRCASCKSALMDAVAPIASGLGATVVLGVNLDDLGDHRPGPGRRGRAGRALPAGRRRLHEGDGPRGLAPDGAAHVGQAGGRLPRVTHPLRHAGHRRGARPRRTGRGPAAPARVRRGAGPPLRRHGPARGAARRLTDVVALRAEVVEAVSSVGYGG